MKIMTIGAQDLIAMLRAVSRFTVPENDGPPVVECVQLRTDNGLLVASATNRYAAAHAQLAAVGELPAVLIHARWAKLIVTTLDQLPKNGLDRIVRVRAINRLHLGAVLEISADRGLSLRVPAELPPTGFPDLARLYTRTDSMPVGLDGGIGIDPTWVALFAQAGKDFKGQPQWHFAGPTKPIRVQIGDTFTGIIMPIRLESYVPLIQIGGDPA